MYIKGLGRNGWQGNMASGNAIYGLGINKIGVMGI